MANQIERVDHLAAALRYASQGVPVFPLAPRSKFPLISRADGGHELHDATTDAAQIQAFSDCRLLAAARLNRCLGGAAVA
jgi:Bifunctional DNA primase/polymerase, N-terminal